MKHAGAVLLLLAVIMPPLTLRLSTCPAPWFDEGLRTNLARTVVERGVYGTAGVGGIHPFDPATSTGPADVALMAASFRLFGIGTAQARGAIVVFGIAGVLLMYAIAAWLWGAPAALLVVLTALAVPRAQQLNLLSIARQVMGETPSMALAMAALWFLFRSWRGEAWSAFAAGAMASLAFYSKGQVAVALLPALVVGELAVGRRQGLQPRRLAALGAGAAAVVAAWTLVQMASTSAELRREHAEIIAAQIRSQFFILGPRVWVGGTRRFFAVLCLGFALGVLLLRRRWRPLAEASARQSASLALLAGLGTTAVWYIAFSTGWARYAYLGLAIAGLFLGQAGYEILRWLRRILRRRWPAARRWAYPAAVAALAVAALVVNLDYLRWFPNKNFAERMAETIRRSVPPEAVIESTDWEIDALSGHWNYHHPTQRETTVAIEQWTRGASPKLDYDMFAADPDYLLRGSFSGFFNIYDDAVVARNFRLLETIGPYRLYERRRG